jgi:hypothetical protein
MIAGLSSFNRFSLAWIVQQLAPQTVMTALFWSKQCSAPHFAKFEH